MKVKVSNDKELVRILYFTRLDIEWGLSILSEVIKSNDNRMRYEWRNVHGSWGLGLRLNLDNTNSLRSMIEIFDSVAVLEREIYEKEGIIFNGNSDMRGVFKDYGDADKSQTVVDIGYNLCLGIIE